ncbi:MAG: phosphotransferase [Steroidobacteraceae bacterium]|nr:phosphotransferase [Steroidobacteraceae bacterium]MDW8259217.1 phosphotransferase [Gammaproteobacteria bacterium]
MSSRAAWLAHLPGLRPGEPLLECAQLGQGSSSAVWRLRARDGGDVVLRQRLRRDPQTLVARSRSLQSLAAQYRLAPAILYASRVEDCELHQYCAGRRWTAADFAAPDQLRRLAERLHELHRVPIPAGWHRRTELHFNPGRDLQARWRRLAPRLDPLSASAYRQQMQTAAVCLRTVAATSHAAVPLHLDLHPGNVLDGPPLIFLDWDYASLGDPVWEWAALWVGNEPWSATDPPAWLRSLTGGTVDPARFNAATVVLRLLFEFWHLEQVQPAADCTYRPS